MSYALKQLAITAWLVSLPALACECGAKGTPQEAQALVKKAIGYFLSHGEQRTMAAVNDLNGPFVSGDLYVFVHDDRGIYYAIATNPGFIGKDLSHIRDANGKLIVKEQLAALKIADSMWQRYDWLDPITHTITRKQTYCEKAGRLQFCAGAYMAPVAD